MGLRRIPCYGTSNSSRCSLAWGVWQALAHDVLNLVFHFLIVFVQNLYPLMPPFRPSPLLRPTSHEMCCTPYKTHGELLRRVPNVKEFSVELVQAFRREEPAVKRRIREL